MHRKPLVVLASVGSASYETTTMIASVSNTVSSYLVQVNISRCAVAQKAACCCRKLSMFATVLGIADGYRTTRSDVVDPNLFKDRSGSRTGIALVAAKLDFVLHLDARTCVVRRSTRDGVTYAQQIFQMVNVLCTKHRFCREHSMGSNFNVNRQYVVSN